MLSITTILFDLDGTIADTNALIVQSLLDTLEYASGRSGWGQADLMPNWGLPLRAQLATLYPAIDLDAAVTYYRSRYFMHQDTHLAEFSGVRDLLEALQVAGCRLGVVTSKKRAIAVHTLELLDYLRYMDVVVAEEDAPRHKPAPDPLLCAAAQLGMPPCATAYLGDNPDDIRAAQAAGMAAIGVGWCLRSCNELRDVRPDTIIETPGDLLVWLGLALASSVS